MSDEQKMINWTGGSVAYEWRGRVKSKRVLENNEPTQYTWVELRKIAKGRDVTGKQYSHGGQAIIHSAHILIVVNQIGETQFSINGTMVFANVDFLELEQAADEGYDYLLDFLEPGEA